MEPPSYDFWLLDLDGTLIDIEHDYLVSVMAAVGDRLGHAFTEREATTLWHGLGGPRNDQLEEWGLDTEAFWTAFHDVEDAEARAAHTVLYDDAQWVADLDRPVGLVTHSQQYLTDRVLDELDIRDWFDTVVCCHDELGWKPDPAPMHLAMSKLGVGDGTGPAGSGIMVGDSPQDIGAAWSVGLHGVHVERHGHERRGLCVLGDYRVSRLDELLGWTDETTSSEENRNRQDDGDGLPGSRRGVGPAMD